MFDKETIDADITYLFFEEGYRDAVSFMMNSRPLEWAASHGMIKFVDRLLSDGIAGDRDIREGIIMGAKHGNLEIIKTLVSRSRKRSLYSAIVVSLDKPTVDVSITSYLIQHSKALSNSKKHED